MELKIYTGKKNDLLIGLVKRWTLSNIEKTITITLKKVADGFQYNIWGMDKDGNDIEDLTFLSNTNKKKYYISQEVNQYIKKHIPTFGEKDTKRFGKSN